MKSTKLIIAAIATAAICGCANDKKPTEQVTYEPQKVALNSLDMRWTFGAHEPYTMYRRIGRKSTGGIDGNAKWVKPWLDWWDESAPALMEELGLNWIHSRFYKGMGWEVEKEDFPNVQKFVRGCHEHGVHVLAYVQFGTTYPEIMKKEIPNVEDWAERDDKGNPILYVNGQYFRYMPCINCEEWEEYIKKMCTIALTDGGFDGIMFDNLFSYKCFCPRCEKAFKEYLQSLPDKEERFGFKDVSGIGLPRYADEGRYYRGEIKDPVIQAYLEWRMNTTTDIMRRLCAHIKRVKPDAVVSANITGPRKMHSATEMGADLCELAKVLDLTIGQTTHYPSYENGQISSRIRELKLTRDLGCIEVALCDTDAMITPEHEKYYLLPMFEDLVFGGVPTDRTVISPKPLPGFVDTALIAQRKPKLEAFNSFVRDNRELFEAPVYAPVRILFPDRELVFSESSDKAVCAAEEILSRRQIPWGYLVSLKDEPFTVPAGTEVIVVPGLSALNDKQVTGLVEFARNGGKLVITGDSGRYDGLNAQHFENPLLKQVLGLPGVVHRKTIDTVNPCTVTFSMSVGAPADHGDALVSDIQATGFRMPFTIKGAPETVAVDVRTLADGRHVLHFVNYDPAHPANGIHVTGNDGKDVKVPAVVEYANVII